MISREDIKKLSQLARLGIKESETKSLQKDLERILDFVSKLKTSDVEESEANSFASDQSDGSTSDVGVLREDREPHKSSLYPGGEFIKVKKVL